MGLAVAVKRQSTTGKTNKPGSIRGDAGMVVAKSRSRSLARLALGEPLRIGYASRKAGSISADSLGKYFGLSRAQVAETVGLSVETLSRPRRLASDKAQQRLQEVLEIVNRVSDWAGGKNQAMAWYRAQPLPAFGGRTAESLVKEGRAGDVRNFLDHVALGGFA